MQKPIIVILGCSIALSGCEKSVEEKPISEFTMQEAESVCKRPEISSQLENIFKTDSIKFLKNNPFSYSPFIDRYNSDESNFDSDAQRKSRIDYTYNYTDDDFSKGFGKTEKLQITNLSLNAKGQDDFTCNANIKFDSDQIYGVSFFKKITFDVKKENNKFITDAFLSIENLEHSKIEPTSQQKEWRDKYENKLNADDDALRNIPDDNYKIVSQDDLYYIYFAQSPRKFSDDELMGFFSSKWNNTTDVFAKEDIKKDELPKIKSKIALYKDFKNIIAYSKFDLNSEIDKNLTFKTESGEASIPASYSYVSARDSYNVAKKGFKYNAPGCDMNGGLTIESRGIKFTTDGALRGCTVVVPDEKAREISATLAALNSRGDSIGTFVKSYLHIVKVDGDTNTIHALIIKDEVKLYDPETNAVILDTVVK